MIFTLLLGLTLLDGSIVYQKYQNLESPKMCNLIAATVAREYFDRGVLDRIEVVCFGGNEV